MGLITYTITFVMISCSVVYAGFSPEALRSRILDGTLIQLLLHSSLLAAIDVTTGNT